MKWILLFLLCTLPTYSRTNYIAFVTGADTNNGTAQLTPWKHLPGDPNATANAAAYTPVAGDQFWLKGGETYSGGTVWTWSGTLTNYITFNGAAWGIGQATNTYDATHGIVYSISGLRSNLAFLNIYGERVGGVPYNSAIFSGTNGSWSSQVGGSLIRAENGIHGLTSSNVSGRDIGYNTNSTINNGGDTIQGFLIRARGGSRIRIYQTKSFGRVPVIVSLQNGTIGMTDFIIDGVTVTNDTYAHWSLDIASSHNSQWSHGLIKNLVIGDCHGYDDFPGNTANDNWKGTGDAPHLNGIFFRSPTVSTWLLTNGQPTITVDGFKWFSDIVGVSAGGTAPIYISQGPSVRVQNAQIGPATMAYNVGVGHGNNVLTQVVYIVNCSLKDTGRINVQNSDGGGSSNINRKVYVYNSIIERNDSQYALNLEGHGNPFLMLGGMDYNLYYNPNIGAGWSPIRVKSVSSNAVLFTLAQWKAKGYDLNSSFGNPQWTNDNVLGKLADLRLKTNSPAIGAGTNMLLWTALDLNGLSRTNIFDVGAFAHNISGGAAPDTNAPTPDPMGWVSLPAVAGVHAVSMTWSNAVDASGVSYEVAEMTGNPGCAGISTTNTTYVNDNIPFGTTCSYRVRARDAFNNLTGYSSTEEVTVPSIVTEFQFVANSATVSGNVLVGEAPPTNLFAFNFEEFGLPVGLLTNGATAADVDYTTVVFEGTQSFNAGDTTNASYAITTFGDQTNLVYAGTIWRNSISGTLREFTAGFFNGVKQFAAQISTNGIRILHGSATADIALPVATSAQYCYRIYFQKGTGANGFMAGWLHTNLTFNLGVSNTITAGTATDDINSVLWGHTNNLPGNRFVYDYTLGRPGRLLPDNYTLP